MYKHLFWLTLAILFFPFGKLSAQLSSEKITQLEKFIEQALADWDVPGVGIGIVKGNKKIYTKGFGYKNLEDKEKVTENTLFAIGSSSKALTALSIMQLVEDGIVELDKPVLDYLPDFKMFDDYVTNHMTIRDLLCHRSGLPRHDLVWYGSDETRKEIYGRLRHLEPNIGFREGFQYQNLMFMTAGYLVGQMTRSTWEQQVTERIFKPLKMTRANFSVDKMQKDDNFAYPYNKEGEEIKRMEFRNIDAVGPAGSINASANEMCNWVIAQLTGGKFEGNEMAAASSIAACHQSNIPVPAGWAGPLAYDNGGGPMTYGMGWFISTHKGRNALQHGGNIDGFSAMVGFLPKDSIGVVVLSNMNGTPAPAFIRNYIFDLMLGEEITDWSGKAKKAMEQAEQAASNQTEDLKRIKGTSPSLPIEAYTGEFTHPGYGSVIVKQQGDSLVVTYHGIDIPMGHYHFDIFMANSPLESSKVNFMMNEDGEIDRLTFPLEPSLAPMVLKRKNEAATFTEEELEDFVGNYLIMNVQKITVSRDGSTLKLTAPGQPTYTLEYKKGLEFKLKGLDGFNAVFKKGADGKVNELVLLQPNGTFSGKKVE